MQAGEHELAKACLTSLYSQRRRYAPSLIYELLTI